VLEYVLFSVDIALFCAMFSGVYLRSSISVLNGKGGRQTVVKMCEEYFNCVTGKECEVLVRACNTYSPIAHSLSPTDFMLFTSHAGITQYVFMAWCLIKEWIQFHGVVLG
jgi:hypothetical protein